MIYVRFEDLDDYLDSIGDEPTGSFVADEFGVYIDDHPGH